MECTGERGEVSNTGGSLCHETVAVFNSDFSIPQSKKNASKSNLFWILTSLTHDLCQGESFLKLEVSGFSLV